MNTKNKISGIILAGGKSSRMGRDKASLKLNDLTFLEHVITIIRPFVDDLVIISDNPAHNKYAVKREEDFIKDSGPLGGLLTGLYRAKHNNVLVLSCDIPLISRDIVEHLLSESDDRFEVNQIESKGKTMPLIALYKKSCWYTFYRSLINDERRVRVALKALNTNTIKIDDKYDFRVQNINTKEEFEAVKNEYNT